MTTLPHRAVGYTRVSTTEQVLEGLSLDTQAHRLRAYLAGRAELVELISDPGVSGGRRLADRPGGARLLALVDTGAAELVCAIRLDRLFRDAADCLEVVRVWDEAGVSLHLLDLGGQPLDTGSAMGRFLLTVMAGMAEWQRTLQAEKAIATYAWHRSEARRPGNHRLFGYRLERDEDGRPRFVPEPAEADLVREAIARFLAGDTLADLARWLTDHTSRRWTHSSARHLVLNPTYAGLLVHRGWGVREPAGRASNVVPIIDREVWEAVCATYESRRRPGPGRSGPARLSGTLVCGACGGPVYQAGGGASAGGSPTWRCRSAREGTGCDQPGRSERSLWPVIRAALLDQLDPARRLVSPAAAPAPDTAARIAELTARLDRLLDLYLGSATTTRAELDARRLPLLEELTRLRETQRQAALPITLPANRAELAELLDALEPGQVSALLRALGCRATLTSGHVTQIEWL